MKLAKILAVIGLIISALFLVSCSSESVIEKATDGEVDVDKEGNIEIKDKEGNGSVKIGEADWDKEKMHGLVAPKAKLDSFVSSNDSTSYTFSEMKEKDAKAYIKKIKEAGFTYSFFSMDDYNYTGTDKDGFIISFMYEKESQSGMISASKGEKPSETGGTIIEGENAKWDSSKVGDLPDPGVNITGFTSSGNTVTYTFDALDNPREYIEKMKEAGFTIEPSEMEADNSIIYAAKNSEGEEVYFSNSADAGSLSYTKATE